MPSPKEFFADRVDCSHMGRMVILSGEFVPDGNLSLAVRHLRCSHQRQCLLAGCDYLDASLGQESLDPAHDAIRGAKGTGVFHPASGLPLWPATTRSSIS
ncbi:hypothetical protein [Holophaga foetida]|uniref:hypothetical protein n=1 Tax=Holophaga foetida TaxID=35839 RepID=UPI00024720F2|nr:hypothetical protein [Holophaga foetida]